MFGIPPEEATGLSIRPHEMRHSWVTHLRREDGIDEADLADMGGHQLATMHGRYAYRLGKSFDRVREVIG